MLWSGSFRRRCQNHIWFKDELQRLYITIRKSVFFYLFYSLGFGSPVWSQLPLEAAQDFFLFYFFSFCFWEVEWEPSRSVVLVRCRQGWVREVGKGCKEGVLCIQCTDYRLLLCL